MYRRALTSPSATSVGPYSHAIDDGTYVFCSGQTPVDPATGKLHTGGVREQTHQCFDNLFAVLEDGGMAEHHVVSVSVYLTDMNDFAEMNEAYAERFEEPYPARTTIGVAALPMGATVEIGLIARRV
jgi:2-iminobutanoate/2-iminopropanoate deaminase